MKAKKVLRKIFPILLLTAVVAISVNVLNLTDRMTRDKIEAQEAQKIQNFLAEMFPEMNRSEFKDDIYILYSGEDKIGYAFLAVGKGYGGDINILVGLEDKATIKDIIIISQTETPGLGTRITESFFTSQFSGVSLDNVALTKNDGQIDAITGSTISSRAVVEAIRETAEERVKLIEDNE